jgi:hypothetical protein
MKLDPVDVIGSAGSSVLKRVMGFFGAGWLGLLTARLSSEITSFDDVLSPLEIFKRTFSDLYVELLALVLWPLYPILNTNSFIAAIYLITMIIMFSVITFTEVDLFKGLVGLVVVQGVFSLMQGLRTRIIVDNLLQFDCEATGLAWKRDDSIRT